MLPNMGDCILNNQQREILILFNPSNFNEQNFTNYNVWTVSMRGDHLTIPVYTGRRFCAHISTHNCYQLTAIYLESACLSS
jgi:hypothetical protein